MRHTWEMHTFAPNIVIQLIFFLSISFLSQSSGQQLIVCYQIQFIFQPKTSIYICSCAASAVFEHYNRKGTVVYECPKDLIKAFDIVEWISHVKSYNPEKCHQSSIGFFFTSTQTRAAL